MFYYDEGSKIIILTFPHLSTFGIHEINNYIQRNISQ